MDYLVLIQARCGASRLPNKVLLDIAGKPDIQWVVERVQKSKKIDEVMVITSIDKNNIPLVKKCTELGLRVFVGSEEDVLDRYYQAAKLIKPKYVVRITADCPMFDWRYLDQAIDQLGDDIDYIGQITDTFPDGLDIEILTYDALKRSWEEARLSSEREHVTMYIKNHPEFFTIKDLKCPIERIANHRWTLDEENDYKMIKAVYEHFVEIGMQDFVTEDVLEFLNVHPEIYQINHSIDRNEGLAKSVANDRVLSEEEIG